MLDTSRLSSLLRRAAWRLSLGRVLNMALLWAAIGIALFVIPFRSLWTVMTLSPLWLLLPLVCLACSVTLTWFRKCVSVRQAALTLDQTMATGELLVSTLACSQQDPFQKWLQRDAETFASAVNLNESVPLTVPVMILPFAVCSLVFAWSVLAAPIVVTVDPLLDDVRASARHLMQVSDASGQQQAHAVGEEFVQGVTQASIHDIENLKERFEDKLKEESFRRELLETLKSFADADEVQQALAEGDGEQIRLAIESWAQDVADTNASDVQDALRDAGMDDDFSETIATLVLAVEDMPETFVEELQHVMLGLMTDADVQSLRQTKMATEALQRDLAKWQTEQGVETTAEHDTLATRGHAVGSDDSKLPMDENLLSHPQHWTRQHWEQVRTSALQSNIDMNYAERNVVERYFTRSDD